MPDISMCRGQGCDRREECYRYRAIMDSRYQSFVIPDEVGEKCEHFQPLTGYREKQLRPRGEPLFKKRRPLKVFHAYIHVGRRDITCTVCASSRAEATQLLHEIGYGYRKNEIDQYWLTGPGQFFDSFVENGPGVYVSRKHFPKAFEDYVRLSASFSLKDFQEASNER